ncbi:MAG: phosphatidate cytidylyltransferase [Kiritimatiellae bacterium]|nr:phosphatidate cytidylyltransferase [Kiritimatiellia bacterium]
MNPILKRTLTGLCVAAVVIAAILFTPPCAVVPVIIALALLATAEYALLMKRKFPRPTLAAILAFLLGAAVVAGGFAMLAMTVGKYGNVMFLYVVAIIKFSDVGGFAFGLTSARLMQGGNHKMCPTISPNKSWEGMAGSIFLSCLVSCCFMPVTGFGLAKALAFGLVAATVGTAGDLVESKFKRWVGVKDSSAMKITNGMGGLLDMFDSLLLAPAALYCFI